MRQSHSSVPLGDGSDSGAAKAAGPCKASAATSFISFGAQTMFSFTSVPFTFPQNASETRPRGTVEDGSKIAILHSEYCHIEDTSTECLPAAVSSTDN